MRLLAVFLLLCGLSGCSALRLAYDNADTYLRWRAGNYLDLRGEDADELDDRVQDLLAWHRVQVLPKYARLADDAARRFARGLSRQDLVWGYDSTMAQARESLRAAAERVAPLLDRLTPEQIVHLEQRFAEDNRKFARENLRGSEQERRQRRSKRTEERLEDWVGRLSASQLERIGQYSNRAPLLDDLRDRDRRRLQREVLEMLRAREAQKRLPELAGNWQKGRGSAFVAANEAWRQQLYAMALDIDQMLSPEQRARAVAQLRRYAHDMRVLAARPAAHPAK